MVQALMFGPWVRVQRYITRGGGQGGGRRRAGTAEFGGGGASCGADMPGDIVCSRHGGTGTIAREETMHTM